MKANTVNVLRGIREMVEEVRAAAVDRFADQMALSAALEERLTQVDPTARRLASIAKYLATDGSSEVECKLDEIRARIEAVIEAEGGTQ